MPRILLIPMYTNKSIGHCTTYIFAKNMIRRILEIDEKAFVYLLVPSDERNFKFFEVRHPRVKLVLANITTDQLIAMTEAPEEVIKLFNDKSGKFFIDAVFTTIPTITGYMRNRLASHRENWTIDPAWATFVMFGMGESSVVPEGFRIAQSLGLASSDVLVWQSKASMDRTMETARKHLSPTLVRKLIDASLPYPLTSIPVQALDKVEKKEKPRDRFVVNYGYSLNDVYNYKEIFEIFDGMFSAGRPVKVLASSSSGGLVLKSKPMQDLFDKRYKQYFDITFRLTQEEFWKRASEAHAFLFLGHEVESSFSVLEQFMLGMVGVFYDIPYAREVTYPGYPFICKGHVEAASTIRYVLENYFSGEIQEVVKKQQDYIREKFDIDKNVVDIYAKICLAVHANKIVRSPSQEVEKMINQLFAKKDRVTWEEFAKTVKSKSTHGIDVDHTSDWSRGRSFWRWMMEMCGWEDDCTESMPVFIRRK